MKTKGSCANTTLVVWGASFEWADDEMILTTSDLGSCLTDLCKISRLNIEKSHDLKVLLHKKLSRRIYLNAFED